MGKYPLGEFEESVMLTVAVLYGNAYGISIKRELEERLDRTVSMGATRTSLKRLEDKGFLKSSFGEKTAKRGGKRKRYYEVTPYGKTALEHVRNTRARMWEDIPEIAFKF